MTQSSASESSSENEESTGEKEDCEEWAAAVIADVSLDKSPFLTKENRSLSIGSDDSGLSCSPKGFWHIHPGSSCSLSDEESVSWSPAVTPKTLAEFNSNDNDVYGFSLDTPPVNPSRSTNRRLSVTFKE